MEKQLSNIYVNGLFVSIALVGLTACGGTATQPTEDLVQSPVQSPVQSIETPELTTAPALDTNPEQTAESISVETPVPEVTTPELSTPESPTAEAPTTDSKAPDVTNSVSVAETEVPYTPDQMVLNAADGVGCDADAALFSKTLLQLTNASRATARMCGSNQRDAVQFLKWNDKLTAAAAMHGNDMASNNFFSHTGSDGLAHSDRADTAGYSWRAIGENIAAGQVDQAEVHQGWLDSEGHCSNIMNSSYTELGAACISDSSTDYGTYWVVVFGDAK